MTDSAESAEWLTREKEVMIFFIRATHALSIGKQSGSTAKGVRSGGTDRKRYGEEGRTVVFDHDRSGKSAIPD